MEVILKELIRTGAYIFLLTLTLYYFVDNTFSTALKVAIISQIIALVFDFKRIKNDYTDSKSRKES